LIQPASVHAFTAGHHVENRSDALAVQGFFGGKKGGFIHPGELAVANIDEPREQQTPLPIYDDATAVDPAGIDSSNALDNTALDIDVAIVDHAVSRYDIYIFHNKCIHRIEAPS
jgi:hypothetical protein